jgi:hypothetical protein
MLELWSPAQQRILATFGALEYSDAVPTVNQTSVVWSERDVVHIDSADGVAGPILVGPKGDIATSLDVSPDGSRVAVVFNPAPGTSNARTGGVVEIASVSNGSTMTVPGSAGAKDLLAWSPDGSRIFFPKLINTSVTMVTYRIGARHASYFQIPGLRIPTGLTGATGSVVVVDVPSKADGFGAIDDLRGVGVGASSFLGPSVSGAATKGEAPTFPAIRATPALVTRRA